MAEQRSDNVNTTGWGRVRAPARRPEHAAGKTGRLYDRKRDRWPYPQRPINPTTEEVMQ
jgi:hypothetical protein